MIEVLAATVLLAVIAAVSLPMLIGDAEVRMTQPNTAVEELALLADRANNDPAGYGLDFAVGTALIDDSRPNAIPASASAEVVVRTLRSTQPQTDHVWIVFECGPTAVSRWIPTDSIGDSP